MVKYQTIILIAVIFISTLILRGGNFVFNEQNTEATAINSLKINNSYSDPLVINDDYEKAGVVSSDKDSYENGGDPLYLPEQSLFEIADDFPEQCGEINSKIALFRMMNGDDKKIFEKYINTRWPTASITKLMTAIVAMENINSSEIIEVTKSAIDKSADYSNMTAGSKYTLLHLINAALVASSNDAAYAISEKIGDKKFVEKMNQKARELSMSHTVFFEPSGLSYLNQSTAEDIYKLAKYIYNNKPVLFEITRKKSISIKNQVNRQFTTMSNVNNFSGTEGFYGGKTGFIDESGGNLLSLFVKNGKMFISVVLGSSDRFGDTQKILNCFD